MRIRKYTKLTFMSWNEESSKGKTRAIALCYSNGGYFNCAINTQRDEMGEKDENGVYERLWWDDYALENEDFRPATDKEVVLYLRYVKWQQAVGYDLKVKCIVTDGSTHVICEERKPSLLERLRIEWYYLKARFNAWLDGKEYQKDDLPF